MRRTMGFITIITLLIVTGVVMVYSRQSKKQPESKKLAAKFVFGKEGKELGEFRYPTGLVLKQNYLFVADSGNARIQILEIKPDGNLVSKFAFGKEGKGLGEFDVIEGLTIKETLYLWG